MRRIRQTSLIIPLLVALIAGCGSTLHTPAPTASTAAPAATSTLRPTPVSSSAASAPAQSADPLLGALVVTVSDRLRVRSAPEVSEASIKYEPVLPLGTELRVIGGPVRASGYVWYDVTPVSFDLAGDVAHGWVAMADHDAEPWLALADPPVAGLETATSTLERATKDPAAGRAVARSVTAFGIDLYRAMLSEPSLDLRTSNLVFSPTSIALALGMARAGARGVTAKQIDDVLRSSGWDELGSGLNALDQALASRDGAYVDDMGTSHRLALKIANTSFAQRGWSIEPAYLDAIASAFGAGLKLVDYIGDPDAARIAINTWVDQRTAGRIPELLDPSAVSTATRLYLVNAIYLKANWVMEFRKDQTASRSFVRLDGSKVGVPTMHLDGGQEVPYLRGDGWQATELRYHGPQHTTPLAMTLILPDDLASLESSLTAGKLEQISSKLRDERTRLLTSIQSDGSEMRCPTYPYSLSLSMPRFNLGTRAELAASLVDLGMPRAFDPDRADFTGIHAPASVGDTIHIANVIHQANIAVDEVGTEAAAATAIGTDTTGGCGPAQPRAERTLRLDHPFLFALRDVDTGAVLFLGRVVDPSAGA